MEIMNADKFYGFLFIHDQLSANYPTHMDSIIENRHFGLFRFSPPDLDATPVLVRVLFNLLIFKGKVLYYNKYTNY